MERPQDWLCKHDKGACAVGQGAAGSAARGGRYLLCWHCCCIYFAGYQHGLVSMPCVWLHPESRKGRGGRREKTKRKRKQMKRGEKKCQSSTWRHLRATSSQEEGGGGRWDRPGPGLGSRAAGAVVCREGGSQPAGVISFAQNQTNVQARKPVHPVCPAGFDTRPLRTVHSWPFPWALVASVAGALMLIHKAFDLAKHGEHVKSKDTLVTLQKVGHEYPELSQKGGVFPLDMDVFWSGQ